MEVELQGVLIGGLLAGGFTVISVFISTIMSYKTEIKKQKSEQHMQKLEALFVRLENFWERLYNGEDSTSLIEEYKILSAELFAWGTTHTLRLTAELQKLLTLIEEKDRIKLNDTISIAKSELNCICCLVLLICQVKYDYIGEKTCPKYWYRIKMPAYFLKSWRFLLYNNKIAFQLHLHWFMFIKIA